MQSSSWPLLDVEDRASISLPPPTSHRGHQRSKTAVDLPPLMSQQSSGFFTFNKPPSQRSLSPDRVTPKEAAEFEVTTPPAEESANRVRPSAAERLASWFDGSSEPVNISLVPATRKQRVEVEGRLPEDSTMFSASTESVDTFTQRPSKKLTQPSKPNQSTRFSFFRRASANTQTKTYVPDDELTKMDIRSSLFPCGTEEINEYSPAAFKNLQLNAEGLLRRYQSAYTEQLAALRKITSDKNIQHDELEAANTRNEHLKLQLTEMAEKFSEQERLISELRAEVASQGSLSPSPRSIRLVENTEMPVFRRTRSSDVSIVSAETTASYEVGSAASIFSDSACDVHSPGTSLASSPVLKHAKLVKLPPPQRPVIHHPVHAQVHNCQKCHGIRQHEAWDVIGTMKVESMALKQRISELESAHDDALVFLSGLKLSS